GDPSRLLPGGVTDNTNCVIDYERLLAAYEQGAPPFKKKFKQMIINYFAIKFPHHPNPARHLQNSITKAFKRRISIIKKIVHGDNNKKVRVYKTIYDSELIHHMIDIYTPILIDNNRMPTAAALYGPIKYRVEQGGGRMPCKRHFLRIAAPAFENATMHDIEAVSVWSDKRFAPMRIELLRRWDYYTNPQRRWCIISQDESWRYSPLNFLCYLKRYDINIFTPKGPIVHTYSHCQVPPIGDGTGHCCGCYRGSGRVGKLTNFFNLMRSGVKWSKVCVHAAHGCVCSG
ncbi:hypothetical protein, partial [Chryseobacterium sp.]|uniref:hypothetical protein n=1 Tax=Chryseobacterium sp. TaxID=1871047 RepID=UPI00321A0B09